jgi:hypothetical protein
MFLSHPRLFAAAALLLAAVACSKENSNPTTAPSCTVTAGAITTSSFGAAGGSGSVPVTAGTGCTWTATSSATFLTISAGASSTGNGTVTFAVAANTGAARTATLTIAGTTFTITQSAAVAPTPGVLSAPTASSPVGGQTITVTRPALVVNNASAGGNVGTVTYRFEVSDLNTFPNDPVRTFTVDAVPQGAGTTSWTLNRDLGPDVLWYWHARATDGATTSDYSPTETFRTQSTCSYVISPTNLSINSTSATTAVVVTTGNGCAWTASTASPFITILSGASGSGSGSVVIAIPDNPGPPRTGTVTIAGQSFVVSQAGASVSAVFALTDPATSGSSPTTECRIRSATPAPGTPTTCTLQSTSVALGSAVIVNYAWTVQYTYVNGKTLTQSGSSPTFSFTDTCGQLGSTADGVSQPLQVTLTVTDSNGGVSTATSGTGTQPPLVIRLFTCGS